MLPRRNSGEISEFEGRLFTANMELIDGGKVVDHKCVEVFARLAQCIENGLGKIAPTIMVTDLAISTHANYALRQRNALAIRIAAIGRINPMRISVVNSDPSWL